MSVRPKKAAESIVTLKAIGTTTTEVTSAAARLHLIAEDPETADNGVKGQATTIYRVYTRNAASRCLSTMRRKSHSG